MSWWIWVILGLMTSWLELFVPLNFVCVFLGLAGLFTAFWSYLWPQTSFIWQSVIYVGSATVFLLLFRKRFVNALQPAASSYVTDTLHGEKAIVLEEMAAMQWGRVECRGTPWTAQNISEDLLQVGQRCEVIRVEGLTLEVKALDLKA